MHSINHKLYTICSLLIRTAHFRSKKYKIFVLDFGYAMNPLNHKYNYHLIL